MILEDYKMEKYIYNELNGFGMSYRETTICPV